MRSLQQGRSDRRYRGDQGTRRTVATDEGRVLELDGLRGIACLAILVYHVKPSIVPFGWAAVDLFFVLSGYLITTIMIRHQGAPHLLGNFLIRRGLRIWPIYFLTIAALVALGPFLPTPTRWEGLPYYLTYTQNLPLYWSGKVPPFSPYVAHLWTLANEEQFYLFWPFLVCLFGRRWLIPLALGLAGLSVAARAHGLNSWLLLARADGFALGGLLAALLADRVRVAERFGTYHRGFQIAAAASVAFLVLVVARGWLPRFGRPPRGAAFSVLAINVAFLSVVGLTVIHSGRPALRWLRRRWLVRVGVISYGLYVYHFILLFLGGDLVRALRGGGAGRGRSQLIDLALMALAYLLAVLSWKWIEQPLLSLKARFPYGGPPRARIAESRRTLANGIAVGSGGGVAH